MGFDKNSISNTGRPVVVKALTISRYMSVKLTLGNIIQPGTAKNKGKTKKEKTSENNCDKPVSFKFLFDVAKTTKDKIKNPVKPVYKNIRASLKRSDTRAYPATIIIKLQDIPRTWKNRGKFLKFKPNFGNDNI
jgi:hypothetical protein